MNNGTKKALVVGLVVVTVIAAAWYFGLHNYFTLTSLQTNRIYLEQAVQKNYWQSVFLFILIYTAVIAVLIPGVPPLTIMGGFLFGVIPSIIYAGIGAVGGAMISFLLMRYVLNNTVRHKYAQKLQQFNEKIAAHGAASYLLMMQLSNLVPYSIIATLAALAHVSIFTFFWTTVIGSLPGWFVYSFAGRQLSSLHSVRDIFSPSIIFMFVLLAALAMVPLMVKSFRKNHS